MNARRAGQRDRKHAARRAGREQPASDRLDGLGGGPLPHPHQHGAPADHVDVAALDSGGAVVVVDAAEPALEARTREQWMEPVDGLEMSGLAAPRHHRHGVERHTAVDPARGVAGEQVVGQRRQHETATAHHGGAQPSGGPRRQLVDSDAADQMGGDRRGISLVEERPYRSGQVAAEVGLGDHAVEQPAPSVVGLDHLGQQLAHVEHLDAPFP